MYSRQTNVDGHCADPQEVQPREGFEALATEFAKPQFMTTTSGGGVHVLAFTFHGDEGWARRDALHDAMRAAAKAVNS